jgi:hypothetical protein
MAVQDRVVQVMPAEFWAPDDLLVHHLPDCTYREDQETIIESDGNYFILLWTLHATMKECESE